MDTIPHDDTMESMLRIIGKYSVERDIRPESRVQADLGLDSFDLVNIALDAQEAFGVAFSQKAIPAFATVGEMMDYVRNLGEKSAGDASGSGSGEGIGK